MSLNVRELSAIFGASGQLGQQPQVAFPGGRPPAGGGRTETPTQRAHWRAKLAEDDPSRYFKLEMPRALKQLDGVVHCPVVPTMITLSARAASDMVQRRFLKPYQTSDG